MPAPTYAEYQKFLDRQACSHIALVTTSNTADLAAPTNRIYIGGTGHMCVAMVGDEPTDATFTAVADDTCTSANHGMSNGQIVVVTSTTTLPAGLSTNTHYFVIDAAANTFKLSASLGGAAVNITDSGTGVHTMHRISALISALPVGTILPIAATRIFATGTTATLIIAMW